MSALSEQETLAPGAPRRESDVEAVLGFWFGDLADTSPPAMGARIRLWFGKRPEDDERIAATFSALYRRALDRDLEGWTDVARGRLALILVEDQIGRVLHRGSGAAFRLDGAALAHAQAGLAAGHDRQLSPLERVFFYMPLMHSEALRDQERSVELYRRLAGQAPPALADFTRTVHEYAVRHHEIVARFGRFPHRNECLGRTTTAEEAEFLTQPNSSF